MERLSSNDARRVALAAQGFARSKSGSADRGHVLRLANRLNLFQIDSVNVLTRAHYLPAFSRLGPYDRSLLDRSAWGRPTERRLFEYWAHEASLLPLELYPLMRWRMARADRGEAGYQAMRRVARDGRAGALAILDRIRAEGPLAASDLGTGRPGWWEWSEAKIALEWLFYAGHVTTATRRNSFERIYDLSERVIPAGLLALPAPSEPEAHRALVERAARAHGIATEPELRDYFRLGVAETRLAVRELVEEGVLLPAAVPGWPSAYLHRDARKTRRVDAVALLAPFDPLVWERARTERLFDFRYRIEIYVPQALRQHGYYVLPFLFGERLVARVDLKADRQGGRLLAKAIHLEPNASSGTVEALQGELVRMADWLGLQGVCQPVVAVD